MARKKGGASLMAICHARHPRRTRTRICDRGDHCSDLSDQHFRSERARHPQGYDYSRTDNPTRTALQTALASLESAEYCLAFSSGMGAATTAMLLFKKGDHVVSSRDVYGGTYRLFRAVLQNFGLTFSFVETSSVREIERAMTRRTRLVWIESPTNPLLRITDIRAAAKIAHQPRRSLSGRQHLRVAGFPAAP